MIYQLFVLMLVLSVVFAQYDDKKEEKTEKKEEKSEEEAEVEKPGPEYYDEVYAVGYKGEVALASSLHGSKKWNKYDLKSGVKLYQPAGVAICSGKKDKYGRWAYLYVADAGDSTHPGAVYQYNINRQEENPGEAKLSSPELIYGGADRVGMAKIEEVVADAAAPAAEVNAAHAPPAPVDVQCDHSNGGLFIADNNHGQIGWNADADADDNKDWVDNKCGDAVKGVQAVAKAGKWLYWATDNAENVEASGVYRNDVSEDEVDCVEAVADDKWLKEGGAVEKVAKHEKGGWGVAVHNEKVLVAQGKKVYSVGKVNEAQDPEEWSWGHGEVRKVASAHDRGIVYADEKEDAVYVTKGEDKHVKVADVESAYGIDYYAGEEWEEKDSASTVVFASVVAVVAAFAMF